MNFVVDAQRPPRLAQWIRDRGHDAAHLNALKLVPASDGQIWDYALHNAAAIVTKDRDFIEWSLVREPAPQVIWVRFGNIRTSVLMARVEMAWPRVLAGVEGGVQVIELGGAS